MTAIKSVTNHDHLWDLLLLADPSRDAIDKYINQCEVFVAKINSTTCGVCALLQRDGNHYEIMNISVAPEYQGRGIGAQLNQHVKNELCQRGEIRLSIGTGNTSRHQLRLYQRQGFVPAEVIRGYFIEHYPEPIYENGERCEDLVVLSQVLSPC